MEVSEAFRLLGELDSAMVYAELSQMALQEINAPLMLVDQLELIAKLLKDLGRHEESIDAYQRLNHLSDSLNNEKQSQESQALDYMLDAQAFRENIIKEKRKAKEAALQASETAKQRDLALIGGGESILFLSIGIILFVQQRLNHKKSEKQADLIKEQKSIIESNLKTKHLLLNEIHHKVKNNLQVITGLFHLQSHYGEDKMVGRVLDLIQYRGGTLWMIQQIIYAGEEL